MPTPITASTLSALLSAALAQKPTRPLVLALDGRCGSGKTTLANGLAAQLPGCTLLRTDDFYLPPAQRIPDWAHTPCANMDLTRLRDEALRLAYAGQTVASSHSTNRREALRLAICMANTVSDLW